VFPQPPTLENIRKHEGHTLNTYKMKGERVQLQCNMEDIAGLERRV
jgi:hypothetical protein